MPLPRTCRSADSLLHPGPLRYWNYCLRPFPCLLLLGIMCFVSPSTFLSLNDPFFFTPCSWPWSCTPCPFWDYMTLTFYSLYLCSYKWLGFNIAQSIAKNGTRYFQILSMVMTSTTTKTNAPKSLIPKFSLLHASKSLSSLRFVHLLLFYVYNFF